MIRKRVPAPFHLISATALAGTLCWLTPFLFIRFISRGHSVPLHSVHFTGTHLLCQEVSDSQDICTRTLSQISWLTDPIFRINAHKTLHRDLSSGQSGVGRPLFSLRRLRFGHRTADQCPAIATFRMLHTCDDRTLFLIDEPKALLSLCDRSDSGSH